MVSRSGTSICVDECTEWVHAFLVSDNIEDVGKSFGCDGVCSVREGWTAWDMGGWVDINGLGVGICICILFSSIGRRFLCVCASLHFREIDGERDRIHLHLYQTRIWCW